LQHTFTTVLDIEFASDGVQETTASNIDTAQDNTCVKAHLYNVLAA